VHLLDLLGANRADLPINHHLTLVFIRLSILVIEFDAGLVVLVDDIIEEDRYFLEIVGDSFWCNAEYVLAV
jgi:hypothetical protein